MHVPLVAPLKRAISLASPHFPLTGAPPILTADAARMADCVPNSELRKVFEEALLEKEDCELVAQNVRDRHGQEVR